MLLRDTRNVHSRTERVTRRVTEEGLCWSCWDEAQLQVPDYSRCWVTKLFELSSSQCTAVYSTPTYFGSPYPKNVSPLERGDPSIWFFLKDKILFSHFALAARN
jgi:hypothetical protein